MVLFQVLEQPPASADAEVERLRLEAREALLAGAASGKLKEVLGQAEPDSELLRTQARDALLQGARSGKLLEVLREGNSPKRSENEVTQKLDFQNMERSKMMEMQTEQGTKIKRM